MDLYAENILDHYRDPRHKDSDFGIRTSEFSIVHEERNISCGDILNVGLTIKDESITEISWTGEGCAISQAGISILSEELENMNIDNVLKLGKKDIYELLGVPVGPRRFKCALICLHTVKNAIRKYKGLEPQSWLDTVEIEGE